MCSSLALFKLGAEHYGIFDPEQKWTFSKSLVTLEDLNISATDGWQIVHVLEATCGCSRFTKSHIEDLNAEVKLKKIQQYFRSGQDIRKAGMQLPAVPAVMVFKQRKLVYAGPYASGPLCTTTNSFLSALLSEQVRLPGTWLNGEATSCRCLL